jgi:hypothetical protein
VNVGAAAPKVDDLTSAAISNVRVANVTVVAAEDTALKFVFAAIVAVTVHVPEDVDVNEPDV